MPQVIWKLAAYFAVGLSLCGNVGVVKRQRWGMGVWMVANIVWIAYHCEREDWPSVLLFGAYLALAAWGYAKWRNA